MILIVTSQSAGQIDWSQLSVGSAAAVLQYLEMIEDQYHICLNAVTLELQRRLPLPNRTTTLLFHIFAETMWQLTIGELRRVVVPEHRQLFGDGRAIQRRLCEAAMASDTGQVVDLPQAGGERPNGGNLPQGTQQSDSTDDQEQGPSG